MIAYGKNSLKESLVAGVKIQEILLQKNASDNFLDEIKKFNIEKIIRYVDKKDLDKKIGKIVNHQGVVFRIEDFQYLDFEEVIAKTKDQKESTILILDGVADPQNLGNIIRSSECFGVDAIIIEKFNACEITPAVYKVSAGALNHIEIAKVTNINNTISSLKENGFWVYGCELAGESIGKLKFDGKIAIIVGSEGKGIKNLVKQNCDVVFTIPMVGKVNSLNVANASAIALYEVLKQRVNNGK